MNPGTKVLVGVMTVAAMALGTPLCHATERIGTWQYLNVAEHRVSAQYKLSIDTKGLPHMVLLTQSGQGSSFVYQFWSDTGWTKSAVKPVGRHVSDFSMFLDSHDAPHVFFVESRPDEKTDILQLAILRNGTWPLQPVAKHARISNLQVLPCTNGTMKLIYDFSENRHYDGRTTLALSTMRDGVIDEKPVLLENDPPLDRFLSSDCRNDVLVAYVKETQDGYQEVAFLNYDGSREAVKSVARGTYHYFSPVTLGRASTPCIYVFNVDRDGIERLCISSEKVERELIPDAKDGQLPAVAVDSADQAHIAYVDFRRLAYGKQELRYLRQRGEGWEHQTVDYGMNANVELRLDAWDNPHLLYQVDDQLKYATTSGVIRSPGQASGKPERPDPDLVFEKLPITPGAAWALVRGLRKVRKDVKWADKLELESYPTATRPVYVFHQYTVVQDNATSGHTATAGWYYVNAYTGRVTDLEGRILIKGTGKQANGPNKTERD